MSKRAGALAITVALAAGACSSGATTTDDGGADAGSALFGGVAVEIVKDDHTGFLGQFFDAPVPPVKLLDARQSLGGCTLHVPRTNACGGACPTGKVCGAANVCVSEGTQLDVGTLHVTGLDGMPRDARPTSATSPSYQLVPTLPYPSCTEGDPVGVSADAFTLTSTCVADLEVTSAVPVPVTSGKATHLMWKAPAHAGASRVQVEVEISHHGGYKGQIDCDVADTGTLDIAEPLVTALVALGRAGYPTVKVARTARGTAAAQPGLALEVVSRVELAADTGVISCGTDESPPCPDPTTCQTDHTCR